MTTTAVRAVDDRAAGAVDEPPEAPPTIGRRRSVAAVVVVALAAALGVGLRVGGAVSRLGRGADNDEAVAGLVAGHLARGEWHPFYWGQSYGGTQEVLLTAAVAGHD